MTKAKNTVRNLVLSAMFLAIGMLLPMLTGQIQQIGKMLLPMHIPVFLCALICGWKYGVPMAFILPLFRSLIFTMPPMFPTAVSMAFELATYAFVAGFMYEKSRWQCVKALYRCIIAAMIAGRAVWGIAQAILLAASGSTLTVKAFVDTAFLTAWPGIIVQLILIPAVMVALDRAKLVPFTKTRKKAAAGHEEDK